MSEFHGLIKGVSPALRLQQRLGLARRPGVGDSRRPKSSTREVSMADLPVLIAGGGIGGLSVALTLQQIGVPCLVLEAVAN